MNPKTESDGPVNVRNEPDNEQADGLGEQSCKKGKSGALGAQGKSNPTDLSTPENPGT